MWHSSVWKYISENLILLCGISILYEADHNSTQAKNARTCIILEGNLLSKAKSYSFSHANNIAEL